VIEFSFTKSVHIIPFVRARSLSQGVYFEFMNLTG
jgi:hypothetical protein